MAKVVHEIIKWPKVLFPVTRPKRYKAIERAVSATVKPRKSFCECGRNCALNRAYTS